MDGTWPTWCNRGMCFETVFPCPSQPPGTIRASNALERGCTEVSMQAEDRAADEERQSGTGEQEVSGQICTPSSETCSTIVATTSAGTQPFFLKTLLDS